MKLLSCYDLPPKKTDPKVNLVNDLNWTVGDQCEVLIHRRTDHRYFEGCRSRRKGQRPLQAANVAEQTYYRWN
jgi:hypothetical protein